MNPLRKLRALFGKKSPVLLLGFLVLASTARAEGAVHKVVWQRVREDGLVATYLRPKGDAVLPAIMVVGGSEGGIKSAESLAYRFAERGWAALAVAYFGAEGLPPKLANIPLEYFDRAAAWVQRQPLIEPHALAVAGTSRGGELALLVASRNPAFTRVIAWAPSHVVWGPVGPFNDSSISAWTVGGRPLPFVHHLREPDYSAKPYRGTPDFLADLRQVAVVAAAGIPVEKIQGAVLLLSGEDDQVWPSTAMSRLAMKRLAAAHHPFCFEHIAFPGAGHLIAPGSDPGLIEAKHPTGVVLAFGGNKAANGAAQEKGWAKVLEFLRADIRPVSSAPAPSNSRP
ncbi:MAG TPA: acyl-CoA thioester hydrolase/BAAT C-terminal domain-containing protein [Opitutaceae bacterium]|nr:acyl-CoA thioester hydrolase/BAAT C-terminal domain-containing protein [Opitutaceae bacterium]